MNNFNAALKSATTSGMSAAQAQALKQQVAQTGKIEGALRAVTAFVEKKAGQKVEAAPAPQQVSPPPAPEGISPEAQQAFLHGGAAAQNWIAGNAAQLQRSYLEQQAAAQERARKEQAQAADAARWTGLAAMEQAKIDAEEARPWWEKALDAVTTVVQEKVLQPAHQAGEIARYELEQVWENTKELASLAWAELQSAYVQVQRTLSEFATDAKEQAYDFFHPVSANPTFTSWSGASYQPVTGQLFIKGGADSATVHPSDIDQNVAPDCGFMSSLAEIAMHRPDFIQNMVQDNADGTYTVTFYREILGNFYPVEIRVDGQIPLRPGGAPKFAGYGDSQGSDKEVWVAIVEKAYAVYNSGSYESTQHWGNQAIEHLTGQKSQYFDAGELTVEDMVGIRDQFDQGYSVTATSQMDSAMSAQEPLYQNRVLIEKHEYYVTDIMIDSNGNGGTITLRNPWGWKAPPITLSFEDFSNLYTRISTNPILGP